MRRRREKKKEGKGRDERKEREGLKSGEENEIEAGEREEQKERQIYDMGAIPLANPSEGYFTCFSNYFYLSSRHLEEGGGADSTL